ncbi:MAG: MMPL family transporter [Actinobacteria bacterium]|nr:MMPL family transporter [Actinomycetota bacterium]
MLASLARFSVRHRRIMVFGIWIPLLIVVGMLSGKMGSDFSTQFELPKSEANDVQKLLEANSPNKAGFSGEIVFASANGVNSDEVIAALTPFFDKVGAIPGVTVTSPFIEGAQGQINPAGTTGFASLDVSLRSQSELISLSEEIQDMGKEVKIDGLTIEYGGNIFAGFEMPASELYGLLAAMVILVLAFGSVLAMGLPIGTALIGLGVGSSLAIILSHVVPMPDFTTSLVAMIGLGVGIDYALFIVTRYREGLSEGLTVEEAVIDAVDTSGRAVIFAGITVIISLLGLFVMGLAFARGLAIGAVVGVLVMMLASVTLLPSLLAMVKHRIGVTTWAALIALIGFIASALVAVITETAVFALIGVIFVLVVTALSFAIKPMRRHIPRRTPKAKELTFWYRWSRFIQRRPWTAAIGATAVLLVLAAPLTSIRLGFGDNGNSPESQTVRRAYDMLADGFGPGFNGPLFITVQGDAAKSPEALQSFVDALKKNEGIAFAQGMPASQDGSLSLVMAYPTTSPQDEKTEILIRDLRANVIPQTGVEAKVGGFTAAGVDFADSIGSRMPYLFIGVLSLSFLLLMAVFRSLLVPLKAVIMNLLSIGAAYGVLVAVFQWGWGMSLIGVGKAGPIESWAPMMLFAIVFGLSMDYEVFLLSRVKEEYDRTGDNASAVADGLTATARVITAAALIMVCVFAAFVLGYDRQLKLFGLGLALAVFIDATIVRMVLVPATMELLGDRNWWIPSWISRVLPKIDVEGHHVVHKDTPLY